MGDEVAGRVLAERVDVPFRTRAKQSLSFSSDDFDEMLRSQAWVQKHLRMARDGEPVAAREFEDSVGRIDLSSVWDAFACGASLILHRMERGIPRLAKLTRELAAGVEGRAWVTGYISPPGHGAFAPHADEHHVLVLQISGVKTWRVEAAVQIDSDLAGKVLHEHCVDVELSASEILFIPQGVRHSATSRSEVSIHLSVGFRRNTWTEVLTSLMNDRTGPWNLPATRRHEEGYERRLEGMVTALREKLLRSDTVPRDRSSATAAEMGLREAILLERANFTSILRGRSQSECNIVSNNNVIIVSNRTYQIEIASFLHPIVEHLSRGGAISIAELGEIFDTTALKAFISAMMRIGLAEIDPKVDNGLA